MKMTATKDTACYQCGWIGESNNTGDGATCPTCGSDAYDFEQAEYNRCFPRTIGQHLTSEMTVGEMRFFIACGIVVLAICGTVIFGVQYPTPTPSVTAEVAK